MDCQELERGTAWIDFITGEFSSQRQAETRHHIRHCTACRAQARMLREMLELLPDLPRGPDLHEDYYFPPPPLSSPPLEPTLRARLLAISEQVDSRPTEVDSRTTTVCPPLTSGASSALLRRQERGPVAVEPQSFMPIRRWFALAAAVGVLLLFPLIRQTPQGIDKAGSHGRAGEFDGALRMELAQVAPDGHLEPLALQSLSPKVEGLVLEGSHLVLPLLESLDRDLSNTPWFLLAFTLDQEGRTAVLVDKGSLRLLPVVGSSGFYRFPELLQVAAPGGALPTQCRLFLLLTQQRLDTQRVLDIARGWAGIDLATPRSLLSRLDDVRAAVAAEGRTAFEASVLVEMR